MMLQVACESKFLESCNIIIYCAERTAYTWQSMVETKLCWKWKPARAGAVLKAVCTKCLGFGFSLPLLSWPLFVLLFSADGRPGSSQTFRGLFEERANDSFFKCLSMYVCPRLSVPSEGGKGLFSVSAALLGGLKVSKSLGCTASQFCVWPLVLLCCAGSMFSVLPTLIFPFHFKWTTYW